jgi:hypothetical protein
MFARARRRSASPRYGGAARKSPSPPTVRKAAREKPGPASRRGRGRKSLRHCLRLRLRPWDGDAKHGAGELGRQRTNAWRKVTSPARGFRRLTSDRQRGAIPPALPIWGDSLRGQRCRSFAALCGTSRAAVERASGYKGENYRLLMTNGLHTASATGVSKHFTTALNQLRIAQA